MLGSLSASREHLPLTKGMVLQVRNPAGQEGGVCKVGLRLKAFADNPIQCVATACQFKDGSGKIQCKNAQCACQQGSCPGENVSLVSPSRTLGWLQDILSALLLSRSLQHLLLLLS